MTEQPARTDSLGRPYLAAAAICLTAGAVFGVVSAVPNAWPSAPMPTWLTLQRVRPLHTGFVVAWIFFAYLGALFAYMPRVCGCDWRWPGLARAQLWLMIAAGLLGASSLAAGIFSGREYLEFTPVASALIGAAWVLFLVNFFATLRRRPRPWPVYLWMWATGLVMFLVTFVESHLHLLPFYSSSPVRDLTVQWKSYGGLVGSWNLVVYGLSIYLLERISGDRRIGFDRTSFAFYWLALANLMLGFAHHTYMSPQSVWIRNLSFFMSMTEWIILIHLYWSRLRRPRGSAEADAAVEIPRRFLQGATFWIGINLLLALLISIPSLNALTHGTHVTVAHSMGSTIGINSMILFAAGFEIVLRRRDSAARIVGRAIPAFHAALMLMFAGLLVAGAIKGRGILQHGWSFFTAMEAARPALILVAVAGLALAGVIGVLCAIWVQVLVSRPVEQGRVALLPPRPMPAPAWILAALSIASLPWWFPVGPEPPSMPVPKATDLTTVERQGRGVFEREACGKCHVEKATEAPDLAEAGSPQSDGWRRVKIVNPAWTGEHAKMPSFSHLEERPDDLESLMAYLRKIRRPPSVPEIPEIDTTSAVAPRDPDRGMALYRRNCAGCHGYAGWGDGPAAKLLSAEDAPRDFRRAMYRTRSTDDLPTDGDLFRTITYGMPGAAMPAFEHLPPEDRWQLVYQVKSFADRFDVDDGTLLSAFEIPERTPNPLPIPAAVPSTPELIERGTFLAEAGKCAQCHGADLRGLAAAEHGFLWTDEAGRPAPRSADLTRGIFKSGASARDLYRTLFFGRGGSPMPSFGPQFQDERDRWALVHYVRSRFGR
ncbi:MAG TPA: cbb3-type cytochrome c oxidase subunit I [Planctomycetota bacterium]|nr:cbb3-type cytochrome c oxidase subunit I [Planctomycetota bacterium]